MYKLVKYRYFKSSSYVEVANPFPLLCAPLSTPPSTTFCRFSDTVTGQFYGHTHYDEITLYYDSQNRSRPFGVAYVAPSVTTYAYLNPAYRIYSVGRSSKVKLPFMSPALASEASFCSEYC